ncbi:hypothetical protein SAMN05421503_2520 [Terribacillus aidingensis]|uniref:Uncharacterized protein n=1 Tax=Terribacillus aidingensis TaxID=586416 RepID=A0A285P025_9BACI|nr:hypothetical protein [Terribacillus aidingensis]SNZ14627.1 hypothetical protein SAMN05421503_2520 [Terribacillus aidingensis]
MKKSNIGLIAGGTVAVAAAAGTFSYLKKKKDEPQVTGSNLQDKEREDKMPSPEADFEREERGLTALDHAYKEEWVANTLTPTEEDIKRAEEKANK